MIVYVINKHDRPLMPTNPIKARRLLKEGKAKIYKYEPFTIQLIYGSYGYVQPTTLGVDTGAKNVGLAVVTDAGKVLYTAEVELRKDIKENLITKKRLRRFRRSRKTRYRKVRFLNRRRESGWLPPSIRSRILSHFKQVNNICNILPIKDIRVEVAQFDVQVIMNPNISGKEYQEGPLKGYDSIREYIKLRDKLTCHYQKFRPDIICSSRLEVDHVMPKSNGGTDRPNNLVCSCSEHNRLKGNQSYKEFTGKSKPKIESFKEIPFMHVIKSHLIPLLRELKPTTITYGYITRRMRKEFGLEKSHINDAITITDIQSIEYSGNSYLIKQVRKKKRSLYQMTPYSSKKGNPKSERRKKNTKEITVKDKKWCLWDKVKVGDIIGFISGFQCKTFNIKSMAGELYKAIKPMQIILICRNNNWVTQLRKELG